VFTIRNSNRLPAAAVRASKLVLLDTIGAMVAGSALPENVRLARMAAKRSPHGLCTLAGHGLKSDSLLATFTNATAGVALEMTKGIVWAAAIRPYTSSRRARRGRGNGRGRPPPPRGGDRGLRGRLAPGRGDLRPAQCPLPRHVGHHSARGRGGRGSAICPRTRYAMSSTSPRP